MINNIKNRDLKKIFLLIVTILAILGALYVFTMQYRIESEKKIGASINISGKQRMLSQRILAYSQIYIYQPKLRSDAKKEIEKLKAEMQKANHDLIYGSEKLGSALEYDEKFKTVYFEYPLFVDKKLKDYLKEIDMLLNISAENLFNDTSHLNNLQKQSDPLLFALNEAVKVYEKVAQEQVEQKVLIRYIMFTFSLIFLYVLTKFILLPLNSEVKQREKELEEIEQFSNMVIESNQQAIVAIDDNSNVVIFNSAAESMFGYSKDEMIGFDSLYKIIPDSFFQEHQLASKAYMQGGESKDIVNHTHKLSAKRASGELFPISIGFGAKSLNSKRIVVANIDDISDDVKSFEEIEALNKELKRSLESEKLFLSSMSHEIRTPLNSIIGFLKMLDEKHIEGKIGEWINNANISSKHLYTLINDILDLSKISANQMELSNERIDIVNLMEDVKVMVSNRVCENVTLEFKKCDDVNHYIRGDSSRIKQILLNILGNSAKFTTKGHIALELDKFDVHDKNMVNVAIKIIDTGKGIPKDKIEDIFNPYKQSSNKDQGTGLGLYISKNLIELMGGKLSVESEEDKGTTFTMTLDLLLDVDDIESDVQINVDANNIMCDFSGLKVLMAEDVDMNIMLAETIFTEYFNLSIDVVKNGLEAVNKAKNISSYDLIFMDINMPVMDGIEATKQIRMFNKEIQIIAMTANALAEDKERAFKAGMNDYITKPIAIDAIKQVLLSITSLNKDVKL